MIAQTVIDSSFGIPFLAMVGAFLVSNAHDGPPARTDAVFTGGVNHYFWHAVVPSIIFDIEPVPVRTMIERNKQLIGHRLSGWPSFWRETVDAMVNELSRNNIQMFEISASVGLDGWVAARDCKLVESATGLCV